ncbi:MAG TPA: response regulator [Pyrinomonadaceae bacterium]|jgi:DNA-binding NtrC family response regulator
MARRSILYLDDEQRLLDIFREMFSDRYKVYTANTLAQARAVLAEHAVDIIISDQVMPEIEGSEFLREVAASYPDSFRIMLTGQAGIGSMLAEISSGIIQLFVVKPWREDYLRPVLERARASLEMRRKQ